MPSTSMPRAAMSVAIRIGVWRDLKLVERPLPVGLALVAMNGRGSNSGFCQVLHHAVGASLGAREHEGSIDRPRFDKSREHPRLLPRLDEANGLFNQFRGRRDRGDPNLSRVVEQRVCQLGDRVRHRCREQNGLPLGRQVANDVADIGQKAHIEHAIGLVEDQDLDVFEVDDSLVQEIQQPAGRGDENVDAVAKGADLWSLADSAKDRRVPQGRFATVGVKAVGNLTGQLAGG